MWNLISAVVLVILTVYSELKKFTMDIDGLLPESIPPALEKASVTTSHSKGMYISRPDVEGKINDYFNSGIISYCIVYGAKGAGKSEHGQKSLSTRPLENGP
jgi:hypothetical protein